MDRATRFFAFSNCSGILLPTSAQGNSLTFAYAITQIGVTSPDIYAEYIRLGLPQFNSMVKEPDTVASPHRSLLIVG